MDPPETYPFIMGYLPNKFVRKMEKELSERPEQKNEKIDQVRRLLQNEKNIKDEWFSDKVIVMYLRARKYRVKEAFNSIKRLVALQRKHRYLFEPLGSDLIDKCVEMGIAKFSPFRNKDGCAVLTGSFTEWDPSKIEIDDVFRFMIHLFLNVLGDPMTQVNGIILLFDCKSPSLLRYARYVTPHYVALMHEIMLECLPMRIKAINFFNPNLFTKVILSVLTVLFSEKIKNRVFVHKSPESVLEYVQANVAPDYIGGTIPLQKMKNHWVKDTSLPDYVQLIHKHSSRDKVIHMPSHFG